MSLLKEPPVDLSYSLAPGQYYDEKVPKNLIVLHHTVSRSWSGTVRFWNSDEQRVGTEYGVEKNGSVYRTFPRDRWAIHLFRRRKGGESEGNFSPAEVTALERRSIGIELVSWGALREITGVLYNAFGQKIGRVDPLLRSGEVVRLDQEWREVQWWDGETSRVQWFDSYPEEQVVGTIKLVNFLCLSEGIPPVVPQEIGNPDGVDPRKWVDFQGVASHAMYRPDKTDTHTLFPYHRLSYALTGVRW